MLIAVFWFHGLDFDRERNVITLSNISVLVLDLVESGLSDVHKTWIFWLWYWYVDVNAVCDIGLIGY